MKKKLVIAAVSLLLWAVSAVPALAATYKDTSGHWAEAAIEAWSGENVIQGYDGYFRPDDSITRGEMATILDRTLSLSTATQNPFDDINGNEWYADAVLNCAARGIIKGCGDGTVRPLQTITRQEAAAMISRAVGYSDVDTSYVPYYNDFNQVSSWAKPTVAWLTEQGYISDSPVSFRPTVPITRAETIVLVDNLIDKRWTKDGLRNQDTQGNVVITAHQSMFMNSHFGGDLIIAGGSTSKVILCNCQIDGSIINLSGADVQQVNEHTATEMLYTSHLLPVQQGAKVNMLAGRYCYTDEKDRLCYSNGYSLAGVDVSEYQNRIDWQKVKADGIDFAFIRIGYRGYGTGVLHEDIRFEDHFNGARNNGLKVGVYVFSQALNEAEVREEAQLAIQTLNGRHLDYPIALDWEFIGTEEARTDDMDRATLTHLAKVFCQEISQAGYQPCVYIYSDLCYNALDMSQLTDVPIWFAGYFRTPEFFYHYDIWQYTSSGRVNGIDGNVDMNLSLVNY